MGCWQKQQDSKPSANIPISTIVRPSSHDTSCSLPSHIVLTGSFSSSEHCLLTTRNFSAHNFLRFFYESPTFISFLTLRSGRHICLQTFAWHIFLARSSRTRTQRSLKMLRKVAHKQLARTSLRSLLHHFHYGCVRLLIFHKPLSFSFFSLARAGVWLLFIDLLALFFVNVIC